MNPVTPASERVQKMLARAGLGSRREIETWISAGRVSINGKPVGLGDSMTAEDRVELDGKPLKLNLASTTRVLAYHKPTGEICSRSDPEGRKLIFDKLPRLAGGRWISIGRLDINTSGLLLLTNNGDLANRLMHPSAQIEREYAVRILGEVDNAMLQRLRQGVMLEDGMASFCQLRDAGGRGANHWYHVTLREGRNHEVRRLWESQGVTVSRLKRIRFGEIVLSSSLRQGQWEELDESLVQRLLRLTGLPGQQNIDVPQKKPVHKRPRNRSAATRRR